GWNVRQFETYHWNGGAGTPTAGRIHLYNASLQLLGSYSSVGTARNMDWVANVNLNLAPGRDAIADGSIRTGSDNAQSGGAGFLRVAGSMLSAPTQTSTGGGGGSTTTTQQPVPFGGNCHGAGCTHPDLRPFGGNGPAGTTNISLHRAQPSNAKFVEPLGP